MTFLYSLDNNVAAQSSNLGMVSCFSGATFEVEHRSSHEDVVCGANVHTGSIRSFTAVAESMELNAGSIGTNDPSVDLDV